MYDLDILHFLVCGIIIVVAYSVLLLEVEGLSTIRHAQKLFLRW